MLREGDESKQSPTAVRTEEGLFNWPGWVWLVIGLTLMFVLFRAGAVAAILLRYLIPVVFVLVVLLVLFRLGRAQEWW